MGPCELSFLGRNGVNSRAQQWANGHPESGTARTARHYTSAWYMSVRSLEAQTAFSRQYFKGEESKAITAWPGWQSPLWLLLLGREVVLKKCFRLYLPLCVKLLVSPPMKRNIQPPLFCIWNPRDVGCVECANLKDQY